MRTHRICVLGGSGFIGQELVARLGAAGHDVKVLTRNPAQHRDLKVLPSVRLVRADVHDEERLAREFAGHGYADFVGVHTSRGQAREPPAQALLSQADFAAGPPRVRRPARGAGRLRRCRRVQAMSRSLLNRDE